MHFDPLDRLQKRIFKIIGVQENDQDCPLIIKKVIVTNAFVRNYDMLKSEFINNPVNTY